MTYFEYSEKLERLKHLIEHKQTGTPEQLAQRFAVSVRTIHRMVQQLREHGYSIAFNRQKGTYELNGEDK